MLIVHKFNFHEGLKNILMGWIWLGGHLLEIPLRNKCASITALDPLITFTYFHIYSLPPQLGCNPLEGRDCGLIIFACSSAHHRAGT